MPPVLQLPLPFLRARPPATRGRAPVAEAMPRTALAADRIVAYRLRRSTRRTIGFSIDASGLTVTAPRWVSLAEVERAVAAKGDWIVRKLHEWERHAERRASGRVQWVDGGRIPFRGEALTLRARPVPAGRRPGAVTRQDTALDIPLPADAPADALRRRAEDWLRAQARALFAERLADFQTRHGPAPARWALSSARTRWGSCSADGTIRLNWRLVLLPPALADYVIAHELAHLEELNHGPRFWAEVARLFPDWQAARRALRDHPDALGVD